MKHFNALRVLLLVALFGGAFTSQAQNYHPYAFGMTGNYQDSNWYKDYVGLNMTVNMPSYEAGSYVYTFAYTGTTPWGGPITTPLVNDTLKIAPVTDSYAVEPFTTGYFTNRIAVIWRGPEYAAISFSEKAWNAQQAGAIAVVIINEYTGEGPVAMGSETGSWGAATIPVFMVGNIPGGTLANTMYADSTITMTITPWGTGQVNDLAVIPFGMAQWENYAVPYDQLTSPSPTPYKGLNGAYVANFGTNTVDGVQLTSSLTFTPTGGSAGTAMVQTSNLLDSFPTRDSIWAMFMPNYYDVTATGAGRFDLTYTVGGTDITPSSTTTSFYASDSVYSKGAYDFVHNQLINTQVSGVELAGSTTEGDFVWGNMYYVNNGGDTLSAAQFSLFGGFTGLFSNTSGSTPIVTLFQWVDADGDGFVSQGELHPVATAVYNFNGTTDSSSTTIKTAPLGSSSNSFGDSTGNYSGGVPLLGGTWYYLAVDVPQNFDIYCDGISNAYPRIFGRANNADSFLDNATIAIPSDYDNSTTAGNPGSWVTTFESDFPPMGLNGGAAIDQIDSTIFDITKGLVPSIAMITTRTPPPPVSGVTKVNPSEVLNVFPIPTSTNLNVSINLAQESSVVTYTVLDGLGRFVSKQTHNNVTSEQFQIPTSNLPSGTYFLFVTANGKEMYRTFIVTNK